MCEILIGLSEWLGSAPEFLVVILGPLAEALAGIADFLSCEV